MKKVLLARFQKLDIIRLNTLLMNQIYLSSVNSFNDPYEFDMDFSFAETENGRTLTLIYFTKDYDNRGNEIPKSIADKCLNDPIEVWNKNLVFQRQSYKVCCFSKIVEIDSDSKINSYISNSEILNDHKHWSHYADDGKGLCAIYSLDVDLIDNSNSDFKNINYSDLLPKLEESDFVFDENVINIPRTIGNIVEKQAFCKFKCWENEKEIRLFAGDKLESVDKNKKNGTEGNGLKLEAVIFGSQTDYKKPDPMTKLFKTKIKYKNEKIDVLFYKMKKKPGFYKCDIVSI